MRPFLPLLTLTALATGAAAQTTPSAIDFDRDGQTDLVLLDPSGPFSLLRNAGADRFEDVTERAGLAGLQGVTQALWQDVDADGQLDVLLVIPEGRTELWRGSRSGTFAPVDSAAGLQLAGSVERAEWLELNGDALPDLLLETAEGLQLYRNDGAVHFVSLDLELNTQAKPTLVSTIWAGAGETAPTDKDSDSSNGGGSGATSMGSTPTLSGTPSPSFPGAMPVSLVGCATRLEDISNPGDCLSASGVPMLGALYPLSTEWFVDSASGFVGLGTLSPSARLDVDGLIRSRTGGVEFPDGTVQATASPFETSAGGAQLSSGGVGIGMDTPSSGIHVDGNLRLERDDSTNGTSRSVTLVGARAGSGTQFAAINFNNYDDDESNPADYEGAKIRSYNDTDANSGDLRFFTNDGSGVSQRVKIAAGGDVGIGTGSPTTKLDVNGTIRARTGGFEFPDGTVQATSVFAGTQYLCLGPGSFVTESGEGAKNNIISGVWTSETNTTSLLAPIQLPHGAKITGYTVSLKDSATADYRFRLLRKNTDGVGIAIGALTLDVTAPLPGVVTESVVGTHTIDNTKGAYSFEISPTGSSWPGDSTMHVNTAVIEWTME